jgi:NADPH:quinone reductase-like Zn-dependent oxidoreductase
VGNTAALQRVVNQVESGAYQPTIDRIFSLDDLAAAHHFLETNQATGKVIMVT